MKKRVELIIIDPQKDFCDPAGSLFVPKADTDMANVAELIRRMDKELWDIHVTLDTHHNVDIAHPIFWVDSKGNHPDPFTIITSTDFKDGVWMTTNPVYRNRDTLEKVGVNRDGGAEEYLKSLEDNGRYLLCIWLPHCLIGTEGHNVTEPLRTVLANWEVEHFAMVDYITKGSNFWTEHYSAVQADVPDSQDTGTHLNTRLIETLEEADIILIAGEALSHCVANTIMDIANKFGKNNTRKFVLLEDASSSVTGFEDLGKDFVRDMTAKGM
ncbi:hypothetical protein LCGC14_2226240, partial [marine sediment metagenome]